MKKVIINFSKLREADLLALGNSVAASIEGNTNFPSPPVTIEDFKKTLTDYGTAITEAKFGGRNAVSVKNTLQALVVIMMRDLAMYVNAVCKGNVDMLTTTAFPLTKEREPIHLTAPVIKQVLQGLDAGSLIVKATAVKGAKSYVYQLAADPMPASADWQSFPDSRTRFEFTGLEEGKKYWFRVIAVGSNNQTVTSAEVAQYVMQRTISKAA